MSRFYFSGSFIARLLVPSLLYFFHDAVSDIPIKLTVNILLSFINMFIILKSCILIVYGVKYTGHAILNLSHEHRLFMKMNE